MWGGPQTPEFFTCDLQTSRKEIGDVMPKEEKDGYLSTRHFQDHHYVPFDEGDYAGVRVAGDDTSNSLNCDESLSN